MARTATRTTPQRPDFTDSEYLDLLAIRLGAMHGFEKGTVTAEVKNRARAEVRKARKSRKVPAQVALNTAWNEHLAKVAAEAEAKKAARSTARKSRRAQPAVQPEPAAEVAIPESETVAA